MGRTHGKRPGGRAGHVKPSAIAGASASTPEALPPLRRALAAAGGVLTALLLAVAVELPFLESRIERDSGIHLTAACEILAGRVMYRDLWENRPPGIHYTDALAFRMLGVSALTIRACNVLLIALNTLVFHRLARRFVPRRGALPLAAVFMFYIGCQANRDEFNAIEMHMILPMMLTIACALRYLERPRTRWAVAAGVFAGVAVLYKQPAASAGAAAALGVALAGRAEGRGFRPVVRGWLGMAAGAALAVAPAALYFARHGALAAAWDATVRYNTLYMQGVGFGERAGVLWHGLTRMGSAAPLWLGFLAIAVGVAAALRSPRPPGRSAAGALWDCAGREPAWTLVGAWAVFDLAAVCYPGFRNPHYFLQVVPSWLLLAGGLLQRWWPARTDLSPAVRRCGAALLLAASCWLCREVYFQSSQALRAVRERTRERRFNRNEALAIWVRTYTEPDEPLCVWGAEAAVYFLSGRRVASRYYFTYPLQMPGYDNERRVEQYVADLERSRPAYIIDLSDESDYALPLFGQRDVPRRFSYDRFDAVRQYVGRRYVRQPTVTVAPVWVRRDLVGRREAWRRAGRTIGAKRGHSTFSPPETLPGR